ncbi:MAG: CDP-alcohol phosphatidyltransferase family protein [Kiloniellaceae bacterium]
MSHDTWIHRVVRVGVRPLARTRVTPNQLTTVRLAVGLAAAGALALGGESWRAWGAALFLVGTLLDRADGELARLSGKTSPWGHTYDLVSDSLCNALAFLGLGIGLRAGTFGYWAPLIGLVAGAAIAAILWLIIKLEERHGQRAGELGAAAGFDPDDALLILPVMVWLGLSDWLLAAAGVGAPVFAVFMLVRFRRRLGGSDAS